MFIAIITENALIEAGMQIIRFPLALRIDNRRYSGIRACLHYSVAITFIVIYFNITPKKHYIVLYLSMPFLPYLPMSFRKYKSYTIDFHYYFFNKYISLNMYLHVLKSDAHVMLTSFLSEEAFLRFFIQALVYISCKITGNIF